MQISGETVYIGWMKKAQNPLYSAIFHRCIISKVAESTFLYGLSHARDASGDLSSGRWVSKAFGSIQRRQSQQLNTRKLSSILYLNQNWQASDGGELRLYVNDDEWLNISPIGGRLVLFLSDQFWHEVLPAKRERLSLTGWFRTREFQPI